MPPKSILKNKSSAHAGPSSARGGKSGSGSGNAKGNGNGRDMERNTRINAGSKFQKSLQVERAGEPNGGGNGRGKGRSSAGKASQKAPVQGRRGKDGDVNEDYVSDEGESSDGFGGVDADGDEEMSDGSADTDEEIARGVGAGEKKKSTKRKRAATTAETFGSTLTSLLAESTTKPKKAKKTPAAEEDDEEELSAKKAKATAPAAASATSAILSLSHARPPPSRSAENLERKAKKHLQVLKEEKEDRARVRDVVEGWAAKPIGVNGEVVGGQEFEKGLRKTAQRGVIKLFNAILIAAKNAEAATTSLSAKAGVKDESWKGGKREKDNIMGRGGKEAGLTQESFLDLVRKG